MKFKKFIEIIKSDFDNHMGNTKGLKAIFFNPKFQLLFNYRVSNYLNGSKLSFINLIIFSSEISPRAIFKFAHPIGIVIGDNVIIYQNVTLGVRSRREVKYPILKDNIIIFANSTIVSGIEIFDNITIGANSFIAKSCKNKGGKYAGTPAKKI